MASNAGAKAGQGDVGDNNISTLEACAGQCCILGEIIAGRPPMVWRKILDSEACGKMHISHFLQRWHLKQLKEL